MLSKKIWHQIIQFQRVVLRSRNEFEIVDCWLAFLIQLTTKMSWNIDIHWANSYKTFRAFHGPSLIARYQSFDIADGGCFQISRWQKRGAISHQILTELLLLRWVERTHFVINYARGSRYVGVPTCAHDIVSLRRCYYDLEGMPRCHHPIRRAAAVEKAPPPLYLLYARSPREPPRRRIKHTQVT